MRLRAAGALSASPPATVVALAILARVLRQNEQSVISFLLDFFSNRRIESEATSMNCRTIAHLAILGCTALLVTPAFAALEYDQNVTPDVIFGSGNANGSFTTDRSNGVELGLRAKQRFPAANIFNSNGDGTYSFATGVGVGGTAPRPLWNFEFTVNTDFGGTAGRSLLDLTYELRIDFDASQGTSNFQTFDPIIGSYFDHAIGDNGTGNGAGTVAGSVAEYPTLLASNNVAQNSWTMTFFDDATHIFDPDIDGTYTIELDAIGSAGVLSSVSIDVIVGQGGAIPEPTAFIVWSLLGIAAVGVKCRRNRKA